MAERVSWYHEFVSIGLDMNAWSHSTFIQSNCNIFATSSRKYFLSGSREAGHNICRIYYRSNFMRTYYDWISLFVFNQLRLIYHLSISCLQVSVITHLNLFFTDLVDHGIFGALHSYRTNSNPCWFVENVMNTLAHGWIANRTPE